MSRPLMILDQHFRKKDELFSKAAFATLSELCQIKGGADQPMDPERVETLFLAGGRVLCGGVTRTGPRTIGPRGEVDGGGRGVGRVRHRHRLSGLF